MQSWKVQWTHQALKDIESLEKKIVKRIIKRLDLAISDPRKYFDRLVGCDEYKLRIGDYRLLALLSHDTFTILIEKIDHRKKIYK
jgi:mRNA interferase RelE/StbE